MSFIVLLLQASTNGLLTFRDAYNSFRVADLPSATTPVPFIAPLWANLDFFFSGTVYARYSTDQSTLEQVARLIMNVNSALNDYRPRLAVVITWFKGRLYTGGDFDDPLSAYEVVLKLIAKLATMS